MQNATPEEKTQAPAIGQECAMISEKQFMWDHTKYSAVSSWLFAIAGATKIGVLCAFSSKILSASEQGKPIFTSKDPAVTPVLGNKIYNRIALGMMAFGGLCMGLSNWLESKKVVTEWQLGAGKLQRKMSIADELNGPSPAVQNPEPPPLAPPSAITASTEPPQPKNWAASVHSDTINQLSV